MASGDDGNLMTATPPAPAYPQANIEMMQKVMNMHCFNLGLSTFQKTLSEIDCKVWKYWWQIFPVVVQSNICILWPIVICVYMYILLAKV